MRKKIEKSTPSRGLMVGSGACSASLGEVPAHAKNEQGVALILALVMLALLGMLGSFALSTSTTELHISSNYRTAQSAYYAADRGREYLRTRLELFPARSRVPAGAGSCTKNTHYDTIDVAGSTVCYNAATRDSTAGKNSGTDAQMGGTPTTILLLNIIGYGSGQNNDAEYSIEAMTQTVK